MPQTIGTRDSKRSGVLFLVLVMAVSAGCSQAESRRLVVSMKSGEEVVLWNFDHVPVGQLPSEWSVCGSKPMEEANSMISR